MRIFKNRWIVKFTEKQGISDKELLEAIARAEKGLIDADLGGGVIKQRIARKGQGKSGGYRSLIIFQQNNLSLIMYAFAKNQRDNITSTELNDLKKLSHHLKHCNANQLEALIKELGLTEIQP